MTFITTTEGTRIAYKDWGKGQPILFSHGWPLAGDAWDAQMLFFGQNGYRVIAHDRPGPRQVGSALGRQQCGPVRG
jgi:non-heme chloroperoxidase